MGLLCGPREEEKGKEETVSEFASTMYEVSLGGNVNS